MEKPFLVKSCFSKPFPKNINKQLRLFLPKKSSIDKYSKNDIKQINYTLLNKPLKSLDSYTPKEAFIKVFDEDLFDKICQWRDCSRVHLDH